jgi:glucose/mannose transport system substrate-binding protein
VFADQFAKAGGTWVDTAIAGGVNARAAAVNRVIGGNPPTAMQFNTGKQFDDLIENDLLNDVDALATAENWKKVMPAAFVEASSRKGKMYAVPVNIHGQNWLWYNTALLQKVGAAPPTNWDDVFAALDKLKAGGVIPLAFSGQKTWERGLFNAVLVGKGGRALYEAVYARRDVAAVKGPEFRPVAETYARLRAYVDPGAPGRNWNDATSLVITGKAGMQVMGDWAKGEFLAAGLKPDEQFGCVVPSRDGSYIMGGDVFVFAKTRDAGQVRAQQALARVLLDPETQLRFAQKKGSVPIRQDIDVSSLDPCARKAMASLANPAHQVPSVEMLATPSLNGALEDVISVFWNTPAMAVPDFIARFAETLRTTS